MGKSKGPRVRPKPTGTAGGDPPSPPPPNSPSPNRRPPPRNEHPFWSWWKFVWGVIGAPTTAVAFAVSYWPHVKLETSINVDPDQTLASELVVTNVSPLPIFNVRLKVDLKTLYRPTIMVTGNISARSVEPIAELRPRQQVAKRIVGSSNAIDIPYVLVNVTYEWPLVCRLRITCIESTEPFWFAVRHGQAGHFLVPAVEPSVPLVTMFHY
jgi:hypothetical protein